MNRVVSFLFALSLALSTSRANADEARTKVQLSVGGDFEQETSFEATMRELVGRLALELDTAGSAQADRVLARVHVQFEKDSATVRVDDATGRRPLTTRTLKREGSAAVFREALAHVILGEVEALLDKDESAPAPKAEAPPPGPPSEAPSPPPSRPPPSPVREPALLTEESKSAPAAAAERKAPWALDLDTQIGGGSFGSSYGISAAVGVMGALRWRRGKDPGIGLLFRYGLPFEEEHEVVGVRVSPLAVRAIPMAQVLSFNHLGVDLGVGFGTDVLSVSPRSSVLPESRVASSSTRIDPVVSGMVSAKLGFWSGIDLSLSAMLDCDLSEPRWVSEQGTAHESVFAPSRLRPFIALGLDFTVVGPPRVPNRPAPEPAP